MAPLSTLPAAALPAVGHFHPTLAARTLVCGSGAESWRASAADPQGVLTALHAHGVAALVIAASGARCRRFKIATEDFPGAVWISPLDASMLVHALREKALDALPTHTLHGVALLLDGLGVLLIGASGSGKSGLALELVARGHALVADDAVTVRRAGPRCLVASCPQPLAGFIQVPDLGVVDVCRLYGPGAVARRARLDLVVELPTAAAAPTTDTASQRLGGHRSHYPLLGERLPSVSLQRRVGHNLAVWVEAACADHRARLEGYRADETLILRQRRQLERAAPPTSGHPI